MGAILGVVKTSMFMQVDLPTPRPSSRRKASRSCPECCRCKRDTTEHVYRQIGARSNMRFCRSHPECSRHSEEAITTAPVNKKRAHKNHRKSRTCVACHSLLKQRGKVGSHVLCCSNLGCRVDQNWVSAVVGVLGGEQPPLFFLL
jgi:hypothetical protein